MSDSPQLPQDLVVTSSPQFHDRFSTARIMWTVSVCLVPAAAWGVYVFGLRALWVMVVSMVAAVGTEYLMGLMVGRLTLGDGSALLTGLLVGMNMPPAVPFAIPVIASVFAITVVKWTFGGLGANWMNPALAGRVFVFFSWTSEMTTWSMPATIPVPDGFSSATVLGAVKTGIAGAAGPTGGPLSLLRELGFPQSAADGRVTSWLNFNLLEPVGISLPGGYVDLFLGNTPGCIGEVSALLLLVGTVYLFATGIISWEIPASYFGVFALLTWVFGGVAHGEGIFAGDVLFHALSGGLILGVFYMATDMVTSPMQPSGMLIYGAGAGFLTFLIRTYGSFPEGVSLAIILMNIFVPLIDRATRPRPFGTAAAAERDA